MTNGFPRRSYNNHVIIVLFCVLLTCYSCHAGSLEVNKTRFQCVETERDALLHFKRGISVDHCGLLDSWGDSSDCCQWRGIRCDNQSGHVIGLKLRGSDSLFDYFSGLAYNPCFEGTVSDSLLNLTHLKYLDLSNNDFSGQLPTFIGSFASLEHLNLSCSGFSGVIPQEFGNLSRLTSLDLHVDLGNPKVKATNLEWLSRMRLLREVDLSHIDLSATTNTWLSVVNNLPFLRELRLDTCQLSLKSQSSLSYTNSSTTLSVLSLSRNYLNDTSIFEWLLNLSGLETNLIYLDLSVNDMMFGNSLQMSGRAMKLLDKLCSLKTLSLSVTNLHYDFSKVVESFYRCPHKALVSLNLAGNQLWGSIPDNIGDFSYLRELDVSRNHLNGTITQAIRKLTMVESLDLSYNSLEGNFTSVHLTNLSQLRSLSLRENIELEVSIDANWIPPFQLDTLVLGSCKVGPYFPKWILTQKKLQYIDISNSRISDTIPTSFWNSSLMSGNLSSLMMSNNMIYGTLPDLPINLPNLLFSIDLSFNNLEGEIPAFLRNKNVSFLVLNNNNFSKGLSSFLCPHTQISMDFLDLSSNSFSEKFPDCWNYFERLSHLNLENNNIWGNVPTSIGSSYNLMDLHLSNNNLSGELPKSIENCTSLFFLDLSYNSLEGDLPSFGHSLEGLTILNLQNNRFSGVLPTSFCELSQLRFLDLSQNHISGIIPSCIDQLVGMADRHESSQSQFLEGYTSQITNDSLRVTWKRTEQTFSDSILLKGIDMSNNELEGDIPEGISSLVELQFLNLSRNNLRGAIISRIGQLTSLESLDLSHNHLTGEIPTSLAQISSLSTFDISDNNLTGTIPIGTQLQSFDASSYMGNHGLCGAPLPTCAKNEAPAIAPSGHHEPHKVDEFMLGVYISVILGFIFGFWGVCGTLVLKRSWRHAYFRFHEDMRDKVYVLWVVNVAKVWRRS